MKKIAILLVLALGIGGYLWYSGYFKPKGTNANFVKNAPPEVITEANAQLQSLEREHANLTESLGWVDELKP